MVDAEKNPRVQVYLYFADEWREKGIGYLDFSIHKSLSPDIVSLDKNAGTSSDIVVEVNKEETSEKNINDNAKEKTLKINSSNISEDASKALLNSGIAGEDSPKLNEGGSIEEIFDHKIDDDDDDDEETDVSHNEKDSDENVVNNRVITNIEIKVFDQDNESLKLLDVSISDETDIKLQEETIISWYDGVYERALSFESPKDCITVFSTIVKARELKENEKSTESTSNQNSLFGLSEDDILSSSETYPEVSVESLDKWMDALKQDSKLQSNLGDISQSKDAVNISSFSTAANLYNYLNKNDIIEQFVILFHTLESEEDLFHLFKLNIIFKSFLGYDSFDIFSLLFEKSNIMDIIGILEYDHTFDERVNHRDYLKTKTNFKKFFMIDKSVKTSCSEWSFLNNDSVSSSSSLSFAGSEGPVVKFDNDRNEEIVPLNDPSSSNGSIEEFDSAEKTDERSDSAERAGTADKIESSLKTDFDEKIESSLKTDFDEKIESSETASPVNVLGVADRIPEQRKIEDRNSEETVFFEKDAHSEAIVEQETVDEKNSCNKENIKAKEYTDDKSDIVKNGSYEKETNDTKISKKERRNEEEEEKEKNSVIEEICGKAVLIYRVQYIIDNFMPAPNIFEDKSTCLLNYVNHHKANLCNVIYDNTELMQNIFIFLSDISDEYSKKEQISDAVYFLHEFCHLSRSLNPYDKEFFFGWLETYNLLPTMNFLLCECELGIKKKALDIITLIIDFKITTVREFVVKQINENLSDDNSTNDEYSRVSLLDEVIKIMVEYHDDPISLVCNDIINSLLDNENQASKKAEMQNFYNGFFSTSFCLLTKCFTDNVVDGVFINDDYKTSSLLAKILSLCSRWCLISAPTFIDSLILNGSIKYASCFFQSKHKFLVCESIKFFRKLIGLDNVEINEQIAKEEVIIKIADFFKNVAFVNNLLNNLILELFDHIVDEDLHMLFNPIVDKYRALYESINYIEVFQRMIAKREISSNRNSNFVSLSLNTTANSDRSNKEITPRKRSHETDEETWFESEDETKKSKDSSSPENDRDDEYTEKSINELFANKVKGKILIEEEEDALDKIVNSNFVQEGNSNFKPTITKNNKKKPEDGIFKFTFKKLISNPPPPPLPTDHISKSLPNNIHMNTVDNGFDPSHFEKLDEFNNDEMDDASKKKSDDSDETQDQLVNI